MSKDDLINNLINENELIKSDDADTENDLINYRKLANKIKEILLDNGKKYTNAITLLDLGTGRGNDMLKWNKIGLRRVIGMDISENQIKIGIKRYNELLKHNRNIKLKINFIEGSIDNENDIKNMLKINKMTSFNFISNNFSMNYLNVDKFLSYVSKMLDVNGLFIGTATDGDMIKVLFNMFGTENEIKTKFYNLKYEEIDSLNNILYSFRMNTPYFGDDYIKEKTICKEDLVLLAEKYNLYPYSLYHKLETPFNFINFVNVDISYKSDEYKENMKKIIDIYSLFFGFSFIKIDTLKKMYISDPMKYAEPIIIIPYKKADKYEEYMIKTLSVLSKLNMKILIVEYKPKDPQSKFFNRGYLLNLGIKAADKILSSKYVILHDCDLIPDDDLIKWYFKYPLNPIHLGARGQRYSDDINFTGGVSSISIEHLNKSNGFPLEINKWGTEDEILRDRLKKNGIYFTVPSIGKVIDLEELNISDKLEKLYSEDKIISKEEKKYLKQDIGLKGLLQTPILTPKQILFHDFNVYYILISN